MATVLKVSRTCNLILYLILFVNIPAIVTSEALLNSFSIVDKKCDQKSCVYILSVRGSQFLGHKSWRLTSKESPRGGICDSFYPNYELREVESSSFQPNIKVYLPLRDNKIYFCLRESEGAAAGFGSRWIHQGTALFLQPKNSVHPFSGQLQGETQETQNLITLNDLKDLKNWADLTHDTDVNYLSPAQPSNREREDIQVLNKGYYDNINSVRDKREIINLKDELKIDLINVNKETIRNNENTNLNKNSTYIIINKLKNSSNEELNKNIVNKSEISINYNQQKNETELKFSTENNKLSKNLYSKHNEEFSTMEYKSIPQKKSGKILPVASMENSYYKLRLERQVTHPGVAGEIIGKGMGEETEKGVGEEMDREMGNEMQQGAGEVMEKAAEETPVLRQTLPVVAVEGLRVEESVKDPVVSNGIPSVLTGTPVTLRLFGTGLSERTVIMFTRDELSFKQPCKYFLKGEYQAVKGSVTSFSALFKFTAPEVEAGLPLYICAKTLQSSTADISKDTGIYYAMGSESYKAFATHDHMLPLWATVLLIALTLSFSSLFSGLNLGLMALDRTQLKIIANTGTENERRYARTIMPVREKGNYLLCSILLGNVLVNSIFTILLDELTSGLFAVIFATLAIVLFGEITPQAVCSRHGLFVGAKTIFFTKITMALTAPLAYPVSKLLDYFLGEEIGNVYNRERLQELIKVTTADLDKDEVNIISGTLDLRKKKVSEIMTRLEDVFMLPITAILDFQTMSEIVKSGYSRIPVYENERSNIVTVLFIKDLAFVDPDDNTPLRTLCQYYQNPCNFVFEDVTLDVMFRQFKEGHKGHMAFVHRINTEGEGDPFYETIGLFTLEDVIEEMIQAEIVDETDVFVDNRSGRRRKHIQHKMQDFAAFAERHENQRVHISPQLTLATFQFLSSSVPAFGPYVISETVLRRLLKQDVIHFIRMKDKDSQHFIYQAGKPVDYFVLILEGRVEVTVGRENLVFEAGPFTYFGEQALTQNVNTEQLSPEHSLDNVKMDSMVRFTFVPDYSVRAIADTYYLTVKRALYLAAKRATMMEKGALSRGMVNDQFDTDIDKNDPFQYPPYFSDNEQSTSAAARMDAPTTSDPQLLQSVEDGGSINADQKTPSRQISPNPPVSPLATKSRSSPPLASPEANCGDIYRLPSEADEQEKLLK